MRLFRTLVAFVASTAAACGSSDRAPPAPPPAGCGALEVRAADGSCAAVGVPASACAAGFTATGDGACAPVLPAGDCADGTMAVPGDAACASVGPAEPPACAAGTMAIPGESACRDVADCGTSPWGDAPATTSTVYVDAAYAGATSDGSMTSPFKTIGAAVAAASSGAVVAIAAGRYAESLALAKPIKLWGRCPKLVDIASSGAPAAIAIGATAGASEIHALSITGDAAGVTVAAGADGVVIDRVRVHDTASFGVNASASVSVARSLFEGVAAGGVRVVGATGTIDASVMRAIKGDPADRLSWGEGVRAASGADVTVTKTLVEGAHEAGVLAVDSSLHVSGMVIRDTERDLGVGGYGYGIEMSIHPGGGSARRLDVSDTLVARNRSAGIAVGGNALAVVESTRVTGTRAHDPDDTRGYGLIAEPQGSGAAPNVTVRRSLFERNLAAGIAAEAAVVRVEASVVRDTSPEIARSSTGAGNFGNGIVALASEMTRARAKLTVVGSLVERNHVLGIAVQGSDGEILGTLVRATLADAQHQFGYGVAAYDDRPSLQRSNVHVTACVLTGNRGMEMQISDSDVIVDATTIASTLPRSIDGLDGHGIAVQSGGGYTTPPTLVLRRSSIADCAEAGVLASGATVTIDATLVRATRAHAVDGGFGDGIDVFGSTLTMTSSRVEGSARAGLASFGGTSSVEGSAFACNAITLDGENASDGTSYAFSFGANVSCACGAQASACQVLSSSLSAPKPVHDTGH